MRIGSFTMEIWQRDLLICCVASFIVSVGMSQMAPILPLYIHELGVEDPDDVARWAGIVFGCNFVSMLGIKDWLQKHTK